jgi:hypothetical protein
VKLIYPSRKDFGMRLSYETGYFYDVTVPHGMTGVSFLVEGGPAVCHMYRADDLGVRWVWIASKSILIPGQTISLEVGAGWWVRMKIEPLDDQLAMGTSATLSFHPLR